MLFRETVVAQLVERLLPTPEILGSNPILGNLFSMNCLENCFEKTKIRIF